MDKIIIKGGKPLAGVIPISGAKNAALPLMTATLLTEESLILTHIPHLVDIKTLGSLLKGHGTDIETTDKTQYECTLKLTTPTITSTTAAYELVRTMRASILVLGPLLARMKYAKVSLPGGCAIGTRPVDLHLNSLRAMGADIVIEDGYIIASAENGLSGTEIDFPFVSVGATENIMLAATLAKGTTVMRKVAREPEIVDLAKCLRAMGADISGEGTDTITINGVEKLFGTTHRVLADRIEAGSFAAMAGAMGADIVLENISEEVLLEPIKVLRRAGVIVEKVENGLRVIGTDTVKSVDITTEPFPGFPTDLQAQFMAMFAIADGASNISETIFENRFMHVPELTRLGVDISLNGNMATVFGVRELHGAEVMATDLRASMSLVIAGLYAQGETSISRIYHLDRGYANLEEKLRNIGADITRVSKS